MPSGHRKEATGRDVHEVWLEGARLLREEGRLAWLVGLGLEEALLAVRAGKDPGAGLDALTARLRAWVKAARTTSPMSGAHAASQEAAQGRDPLPAPGPARRRPAPPAKALDGSQLSRRRLDDRRYPVVFAGPVCVRGQWASLAVGVDLQGNKHVLGGRDDAQVARLLQELGLRGLSAQDGLLVVTDGSRGADETVRSTWRGRARIQHCLYRLRQDLKAHAPAAEHPNIDRALAAAGHEPLDSARQALQELLSRLRASHPGAAARLERSLAPALTVAGLGVSVLLRQHLQVQGTLRVACEQALRLGDPAARGLEALLSGLGAWLVRTRRFFAQEELPALAERLRGTSQEIQP